MPGIAAKRNAKVGGKRKKVDSEDEAYVASKGQKEKKEKDPDAPKKPQTSYFLFMNTKRPEIKAAEPGLGFGDMTKKLTEMWKALTDEDKKTYEDMAAKDKARYQAEMEAKGLAKPKPVVDETLPKKPLSSFFLFSAEAREKIKKEDADIKQTDILKKIGAQWKELEPAEKKKWEDKSKADKERYEAAMAERNGGAAPAGAKRPAGKGAAAASKKAKKDTQS